MNIYIYIKVISENMHILNQQRKVDEAATISVLKIILRTSSPLWSSRPSCVTRNTQPIARSEACHSISPRFLP